MCSNNRTSLYTTRITRFLCTILRTLGLWKPIEKSELQQFIYSAYSVVFLLFFSIVYALMLVLDIFFLTDFSDLTNRLFMSLTEAALAIKVINFFFNNREWQQILTNINKFPINSSNDEKIIKQRVWIFQIVDYVYFFFPNCAAHALGISPLFMEKTKLIFSGWYPGFDWQNDRRDYWIIYAYQYIGIIITCNLNIAIDSYYCFVIHMLSVQVKMFGNHLSDTRTVEEKDTLQQFRLNLIEKIHTHQRLNGTLALIQNNLQWTYFCQVLLSGIVICSITKELARVNDIYLIFKNMKIFQISSSLMHTQSFTSQASISEQPILFVSSAFTIISFLMQIFLMCFFGQQTMSEYSLLLHQLYSSDWQENIFKLKGNQLQNARIVLTFFMQNLKKDTQILVGKVFPLSLSTFTSVRLCKSKGEFYIYNVALGFF